MVMAILSKTTDDLGGLTTMFTVLSLPSVLTVLIHWRLGMVDTLTNESSNNLEIFTIEFLWSIQILPSNEILPLTEVGKCLSLKDIRILECSKFLSCKVNIQNHNCTFHLIAGNSHIKHKHHGGKTDNA